MKTPNSHLTLDFYIISGRFLHSRPWFLYLQWRGNNFHLFYFPRCPEECLMLVSLGRHSCLLHPFLFLINLVLSHTVQSRIFEHLLAVTSNTQRRHQTAPRICPKFGHNISSQEPTELPGRQPEGGWPCCTTNPDKVNGPLPPGCPNFCG